MSVLTQGNVSGDTGDTQNNQVAVTGGSDAASAAASDTLVDSAGTSNAEKSTGDKPAGIAEALKAAASKKSSPDVTPKPTYQANYKFKVLEKEHEFDDFVKAAIKDAETEKKARELYQRAYGLDTVKADRQTLRDQNEQLKLKIAETETGLQTISEYVRNNDFDSFFEALRIPKEQILKYALEYAKREMSPEAKAQWENARRQELSTRSLQTENSQLQQQRQELMVKTREFELERSLLDQEVSVVAQAYDAGMGTPGAFKQYVIRIGQAYAAQGKDIPASEAVSEAIKHLRAVNPTLGQKPQTQASAQVVQPHTKPTIPTIASSGTSAVKRQFKSIADMKQYAKELEQNL